MNNELIKVDIFDRKIGTVSKEEAHKKGILHKAFSVFLYSNGKLLIQQRAFSKYHSGGKWANTCCSHPRTENLIEDAKERLVEEVGIVCDDLKEIYVFNYFSKYADDLFEYEIDHVLVGEYDGKFTLNKEEVNDMKWVDFDVLSKDMIDNPQKYATWFLICAPRVLEWLKNKKDAKV